MNGLLEVDVTVLSTGKTINKVIEHAPGALSAGDKEKSLKKLAELKFHPRDQEENRMVIAKGERLYEAALGEQREYIAKILKEFDRILEGQRPVEIKKARTQLHEILQQLDKEEWF